MGVLCGRQTDVNYVERTAIFSYNTSKYKVMEN